MSLGQWVALDIETSGIDPNSDEIIDIGFLQFEGTKLVKKYSSLVQSDVPLSHFIQKLTGITQEMLYNAPSWRVVEDHLLDLYGHAILAHNSDFERSFLKQYFDRIADDEPRESYEDSILYLALLFPNLGSYNLERFICDYGIADAEVHRGYEDSLDLIKVLIMATLLVQRDQPRYQALDGFFIKHDLTNFWYYNFFKLDSDELHQIATQIDFDVDSFIDNYLAGQREEETQDFDKQDFSFDFSGSNIGAILQAEEIIDKKLPGYRFRQCQQELAMRVGQSFKNDVHCLVQAPTGTGKTLGYLLPSTLFCLESNKQVLVATGTKTLQHQAMSKDVPLLRKMLGLDESDFKVAQLLGSANHLCELLYRQEEGEGDLLSSADSFEKRYIDCYFDLVFWFNACQATVVTRGDLPYVLKRKFKSFLEKEKSIAVDFRACTGHRCPYKDDCSYIQGLNRAKEANLIIGNHALMFAWPRAFARPAHIVVDEAHKIEGETTSAFTFEVTGEGLESFLSSLKHQNGLGSLFYLLSKDEKEPGQSTPVINKLREEGASTYQMLEDNLVELPLIIETYFKKMPRYTDQYWNELPMIDRESRRDGLETTIFNRLDSCNNVLKLFSDLLAPYRERWDLQSLKDEKQIIALTRFEVFLGQLDDLVDGFEYNLNQKEEYCRSIKYHEDYGFMLASSPVNVGNILHQGLLSTSASVVMTSATLGNATGDQGTKGIEWASGYLYLEPERRFKSGFFLPAVYDYKNKAKVYLCDDTLPFYHSNFVETTLEKINPLIRKLGGKTLLLFSARARFEVARELLLAEFDGEIPLFIQGMGNKVIEDFKNSANGILLGMESFGEGIDVPGDSLQFIFIDKIPDLRMDLVINERRDFFERNIGNEFTDYYLAGRTRSLHQKLGRLLRTENDFGAVIIVDSRIKRWKGRTMGQFARLMEPYILERVDLDQACSNVLEFLS